MARADNNSRKFHLKPFSLFHHKSTMKVGMDSILLGIWADPKSAERILDIGCGSGVLSLLLAFKSDAEIEAVELDHESAEETKANFSFSPFHSRMSLTEDDFNRFSKIKNQKFDLVISNPPFFINDSRSEKSNKKQARHGDTLSFEQLLGGVKNLLQKTGKFYLVLPYQESRIFLNLADSFGFALQKQQLIIPVRGLKPNRINMQLGFEQSEVLETEKLVIREEDRTFTKEYNDFVKEVLICV